MDEAATNGSLDQHRSGDPDALIERVQRLSADVDRIADPAARETAQEMMAAVLELYGDGLERIVHVIDDAGDHGEPFREAFVADPVIGSLLLIHDLYPVSLEERILEALESVRPYMESHGGDVQLLSLDQGVARISLQGSCEGCPASASTLELAIKQALEEAAPDLAGLEVEGMIETAQPSLNGELEIGGTALPVVQVSADADAGGNGNGNGAPSPTPDAKASRWIDLPPDLDPADGELSTADADGMKILVANVDGSLLAYRDVCPACSSELSPGALKGGVLSCPSCERRYYLPRAGRSMDEERLLLDPVPLLGQQGSVRIAVSA